MRYSDGQGGSIPSPQALKAEAASIERRKADLKAQEDFLLRREEEAKCHEMAMALRKTRLVETTMVVQLKKAVLKARQLEVQHEEEEHEHELDTYRDEVAELKQQLETQQAMVRKEAAALARQRRLSQTLLSSERPLHQPHDDESDKHYLERTHSMPMRETPGHAQKQHDKTMERKHSAANFINDATRALWAPFSKSDPPKWLHGWQVDLAHDHLPGADTRASQVVHHGLI